MMKDSAGQRGSPLRVLVVESNLDDRRFAADALAKAPEHVLLEHVSTLAEALPRLEHSSFDVVVLDLENADATPAETLRNLPWIARHAALLVWTRDADAELPLKVVRRGADDFLHKDTDDAQALVRALRYAAERLRSRKALQRYARRLEAMHEIDRAILGRHSIEYVARLALGHLLSHVPADRVSVVFFDLERGEAWVAAAIEPDQEIPVGQSAGSVVPMGEYVAAGKAPTTGVQHVPDLRTERDPSPVRQKLIADGFRSLVTCPLRSGGRTVGELNLAANSPHVFSADDLDIVAELARQLAIAFNEGRLRDLEERSDQRDRLASVGRMVAGIVHDFNNVLQGILGYVELLEDETGVPDNARPWVGAISELTARAAQVNRQLLDFTRQSVNEKVPIDFGEITHDVVRLMRHTLPESIELDVKTDSDSGLMVVGSVTHLQQALLNLAMNARDAMPDGGRLAFRVEPYRLPAGAVSPFPGLRPGSWVRLSVTDTGTGIPADILGRIFEPFFTTKPRSEGTGLGLAQVHGIVADHGGLIDVESEPGRGTSFHLYLPALVEQTDRPHSDWIPEEPRAILLVEDDADVLAVTSSLLERAGYEVTALDTPSEALQVFHAAPDRFALAILDVVMPELSGPALLRKLRALRPDLPVVLMSGYSFDEEVERLVEAGEVMTLEKPIHRAELISSVEEAKLSLVPGAVGTKPLP
jgi:signal transduction histidine kinase/CheY-like chemotaxis protein